jgi:hypothetical protein
MVEGADQLDVVGCVAAFEIRGGGGLGLDDLERVEERLEPFRCLGVPEGGVEARERRVA